MQANQMSKQYVVMYNPPSQTMMGWMGSDFKGYKAPAFNDFCFS